MTIFLQLALSPLWIEDLDKCADVLQKAIQQHFEEGGVDNSDDDPDDQKIEDEIAPIKENILENLKGVEKEEWHKQLEQMRNSDEYAQGKKMEYPKPKGYKGKDFYQWHRDPEKY